MASNSFADGNADATIEFERPVSYLIISVSTGTTFSFSIDKGLNYMGMSEGFYNFFVGTIEEIRIQADGDWQLIGVQS